MWQIFEDREEIAHELLADLGWHHSRRFFGLLGLRVASAAQLLWGLNVEVGALWRFGLGVLVFDDEYEEGGEGGPGTLGEASVVLVVVLLE